MPKIEKIFAPGDRFPNGDMVVPEGWTYYLVSELHPDESQHMVAIPDDAHDDRKKLYEIETDEESLDHLLWEHYIRLRPDSPAKDLPAKVKANFDRVWGTGHKGPRGLIVTEKDREEQSYRMAAIHRRYVIKEAKNRAGGK
jgi:hypothetical protein